MDTHPAFWLKNIAQKWTLWAGIWCSRGTNFHSQQIYYHPLRTFLKPMEDIFVECTSQRGRSDVLNNVSTHAEYFSHFNFNIDGLIFHRLRLTFSTWSLINYWNSRERLIALSLIFSYVFCGRFFQYKTKFYIHSLFQFFMTTMHTYALWRWTLESQNVTHMCY